MGISMSVIILSPIGEAIDASKSGGPSAGVLRGKAVGIRVDRLWHSWDVISEAWAARLQREGAAVTRWRHTLPLGKSAAEVLESRDHFLDETQVTILGLCNCGSCTMWTIRDCLASLDRGHPTVVCATAQFEELARNLAKSEGWDSLRLVRLPYPLEGRSDDELERIAEEFFPAMLSALGAESGAL
jgi:hypothetical protein